MRATQQKEEGGKRYYRDTLKLRKQQESQRMKIKAQQSKLMKILTSPLRLLSKARDSYVNRMNQFGDRVGYGAVCGPSAVEHLPRSFSVSSLRSGSAYEDDDLNELIRAVSARTLGDRIDLKACLAVDQEQKQMMNQSAAAGQTKTTAASRFGVPRTRSASVGMAKIDEDEAVDQFEVRKGLEDKSRRNYKKKGGAGGLPPLFPRSKSQAVSSQRSSDPVAFRDIIS